MSEARKGKGKTAPKIHYHPIFVSLFGLAYVFLISRSQCSLNIFTESSKGMEVSKGFLMTQL